MPSVKKSKSRKLNSYQRKIRSNKKQIAALAEKKGIRFMAAAALMIKGRRSGSKRRRSMKKRSSSKKRSLSKRRSLSKKRSMSKKRSASKRRSASKKRSASKRRSASKKHSCPRGKVHRKAHKSASGKRIPGACVKKGGRKSRSRSRK
jgi:hypothetical protein